VHGESNPAEYPEERYMHPIQLSPASLQKVKLNAVFCYVACDVSITLAEQTSTILRKLAMSKPQMQSCF
jgi:hypothetical protein